MAAILNLAEVATANTGCSILWIFTTCQGCDQTLIRNIYCFTCSVGGVRHHREDVLQDVTEIRLVEALSRSLLSRHVLQESVQDLQTCMRPEHIDKLKF